MQEAAACSVAKAQERERDEARATERSGEGNVAGTERNGCEGCGRAGAGYGARPRHAMAGTRGARSTLQPRCNLPVPFA